MCSRRARVTAGNPPTAVQMLGFDIRDWAEQGAVADLSETAKAEAWARVVPEAVQFFSTYDGAWIAAPVNIHSTNWIWASKKIFDELGLAEPTSWDELIAALDKIQEAGYVPLAHGGQAWQDARPSSMRWSACRSRPANGYTDPCPRAPPRAGARARPGPR
jgi:glucose/mannose transport system substrate-binding protein